MAFPGCPVLEHASPFLGLPWEALLAELDQPLGLPKQEGACDEVSF